jgi:hypothetical protein
VIAQTPLQRYLLNPDAATHNVLERIVDLFHAASPYAGLLLGVALAANAALRLIRRTQQQRMSRDARFITILPPPEADPAGAALVWSNLMALLRPWWLRMIGGQPHMSFEYHWSIHGLRIGIWVAGSVPPGMVEQSIEAVWPGSLTATTAPEPAIPPDSMTTGGTLHLARPEWFPINASFEVDPLRVVLGAAGSLADDERTVIQVLARPASSRRAGRLFRAADAIRIGHRATHVGRLIDVLPFRSVSPRGSVDLAAAQDARLILSKAAAPQYEVMVRYAVSTNSHTRTAHRVLRGRAHAIASSFAVFTGRNGFKRRGLWRPCSTLNCRRMARGDLLSIAELAALAHLPTDRAVPGLVRAGAKPAAPPPQIPTEGKPLGISEIGGRRPVALGIEDARHHLHVMGATGSGKSTLLCNLVLDDIAAKRGVVVVDPKGDLIQDILQRIPWNLGAERVVALLDPDRRALSPALNVLEGSDPDLVVDNVVGIFRRIFEHFWGPRTDDVLRAACLTLLAAGRKAELTEVPELLTDPTARLRLTAGLKDPVLRGFWSWYEGLGEGQQAQLIGPLMNKLRAFLLREFVRHTVGSSRSSFDMAQVLDGGVCLVRVPKGVLGEETARLLGSFVVASVWQTAAARARSGQSARTDAALYVDECHNFLTLPRSFDDMLAEARGYRLSLVLAHQHLAQLPVSLREAISANARSKVFFNLSPEDARAVERHVTPYLTAHDLAHLGAFQAVGRIVARGEEQPAFTFRTRPAAQPTSEVAAPVLAAAWRSRAESASADDADALHGQPSPGAAAIESTPAAAEAAL